MKKMNKKSMLSAAIAGLISAAVVLPVLAADKETKKSSKAETEKCYGVNKCAGHGKCGGKGSSCAGKNECAGQGWLDVPKGLCLELKDGSLTPIEKAK